MEERCGGAVVNIVKKHQAVNMESICQKMKRMMIMSLRMVSKKIKKIRVINAFAVKRLAIEPRIALKILILELTLTWMKKM